MPTYEDFNSHVEAHLLYIHSLPVEEALDVLRSRLRDGSWCEAPMAWMLRLQVLASRHRVASEQIAAIRQDLLEALIPLGIGEQAHQLLPTLLGWEHGVTRTEADALVSWFVQRATPGDAGLAAEILDKMRRLHRVDEHPWLEEAVQPLASWLVAKGSGELRARGRTRLCLDVAETVWGQTKDRALLAQALRLLIANEEPLDVALAGGLVDPQEGGRLMLLVEEVCSGGNESLASDVILACSRSGSLLVERILDPPEGWPNLRACRLAVLRAMTAGQLPISSLSRGWRAAFWTTFPGEGGLRFRTAKAVDVAAVELHQHAAFKWRRNQVCRGRRGPSSREWAELVASEYLRIHDICGSAPVNKEQLRTLGRCVGYDDDQRIEEGVAAALLAALERAPVGPDIALARSILESHPTSTSVEAALRVLGARPHGPSTAKAQAELNVAAVLDQLVHAPWTERLAGIEMASLLRGAGAIELVELDREDKVRIENGKLLVDRESLIGAVDVPFSDEERRALTALYVVHELVHVAQAIGDKAAVTRLRTTGLGGETNLMHLDLGADHAAAVIVEAAFPRWSLIHLKNLQGRSLTAFPAGLTHSTTGRFRKVQRLVGLRVDFFVRALGLASAAELGDGYAFADFGPCGGELLVLTSGPPFGVLGGTRLSPKEAAILYHAVERDADHAQVDEVIKRSVRGACIPPPS